MLTLMWSEVDENMLRQEQLVRERSAEAKSALLSVLTPAQAQQYQLHSWFELNVNGHCYRIVGAGSYNVYLMCNGAVKARYCAGPNNDMPDEYFILAQFLMLTTNEAEFLRIANISLLP